MFMTLFINYICKYIMKFDIIVAVDNKFGIGLNQSIPWHIKEDIIYFRNKTTYTELPNNTNVVIMGRKTWETLPNKILNNRINIVVTHQDITFDGIIFVKSFDEALNVSYKLNNIENIFVIGGAQIYNEALHHPNLRYVYMTKINHDYECDINITFDEKIYETLNETIFNSDSNNENKVIFFMKYQKIKNHSEHQYLNLLTKLINYGHRRQTRNAVTYSLFGEKMEFDLSKSFPLYTTKKVFFRGIFEELKFFLLGQTDSKILEQKGVNIWKGNTSREFLDNLNLKNYDVGWMGSMYGYNMLHFGYPYEGANIDYTNKGFNQIEYVLNLLKNDPYSRRCMFTTYNPATVKEGVLYPCHGLLCQFYVEDGNKLSCSMIMRSCDIICGNPFNVASYALLVHIICELLNNDPTYKGDKFNVGRFIIFMNDVHLYEEHISQANEQLTREPYMFPKLKITKKIQKIDELEFTDIELIDYKHYPAIKADMVP